LLPAQDRPKAAQGANEMPGVPKNGVDSVRS
jgi:hypothetical protein